jgi:hypothetical protein
MSGSARLLPGKTDGNVVPNEYDDDNEHELLAADEVKSAVDVKAGRALDIAVAETRGELEMTPVNAAECPDCKTKMGSRLDDEQLDGTASCLKASPAPEGFTDKGA